MAVPAIDPFDFTAPWPLDLRFRRDDIPGRDSIPTNHRWEGMPVYVTSEQTWYYLRGGTGNENWAVLGGSSGIQNVTFRVGTDPTGGDNGDISFVERNDAIELWYRQGDSWGMLGSWSNGGGVPPIHERPGVDFQTTSATLNGWYPDAVEGEVVWGQDGSDVWVFTKRGANWSVRQEQIA